MAQYVYTMRRVGKVVPPKRFILKNISLNFLRRRQDRRARPERLGQVHLAAHHGGRGQGLRRRGGRQTQYAHRLFAAGAAARCGQERARGGGGGPGRGVRREEAPGRGLRRLCRARRRLRQTRGRAGGTRGGHRRFRRRQRRASARDRRRRAAPAAVGGENRPALRRREAPRGAVPPAAVQARPAAARRAHQPPRCRERRVAGAVPAEISRHRGGGDPRPLLSRQRGAVDPRTRPRLRHPVGGQLQFLAGAEGSAPGAGGSDRIRAPEDHQAGAGMGAPEPEGAPGEKQGAPGALRRTLLLRLPEAQRDAGNFHPGGRAPGRCRDRVQGR